MGGSAAAEEIAGAAPARGGADRPAVIEVRGLDKSFRVPEQRIDSLRERATHPFRRVAHREHRALRDVSFDVRQGEFFGIVGRNGSGKSTLLKILAGIYGADRGRVRTAGRVAPFIELGVGFNPELTARENAVLNGVLMGMTLREARRTLDAVLDFAELEDFVDLKLKNYSSGMLARFAFAVMVRADADVMLIDEVLAVGDAAFAQKCMDVFHAKRRAGKTIVLVTHDMTTVQTLCHRALLLHDGELRYIGEPEDAALRYYRLNFAHAVPDIGRPTAVEVNTRVVTAALRDAGGETVERVGAGTPLRLDVVLEAARGLDRPAFSFQVRDADGVAVFEFSREVGGKVAAGRRVAFRGEVENRLVPGRYDLDVYVGENDPDGGLRVQGLRLLQFVVEGEATSRGMVDVRADVEPELEP